MKSYLKLIPVASIVFFSSCNNDTKNNTETGTTTATTETVVTKPRVVPPDFSADSAYTYIAIQDKIGPRVPGSSAHAKAVAYYESFFKQQGGDVKIQGGSANTFDGKQWRIDNVIAVFNPAAKKRILLCSHYDSRPFADKDPKIENKTKPCPGTNDGASGVGVLMEIARQIKLKQPEVGIDVVLFDLEDYGDNRNPDSWAMGSQDWAKNPHRPGYKAEFGILLDMVGAKNAVFPKEGLSVFYANDAVTKIWGAADRLGYGNYFVNEESAEMTDDHLAVNKIANIPCVDILHYNYITNEFFEHHHTTTDDINTIDKNTLKAVGQTLMEVIYNE